MGAVRRPLPASSLGVIQDWCLEEKKPPLTILVVNQGRHQSGQGFMAWDVANLEEGYEQVYVFPWSELPNPFEFADDGAASMISLTGSSSSLMTRPWSIRSQKPRSCSGCLPPCASCRLPPPVRLLRALPHGRLPGCPHHPVGKRVVCAESGTLQWPTAVLHAPRAFRRRHPGRDDRPEDCLQWQQGFRSIGGPMQTVTPRSGPTDCPSRSQSIRAWAPQTTRSRIERDRAGPHHCSQPRQRPGPPPGVLATQSVADGF